MTLYRWYEDCASMESMSTTAQAVPLQSSSTSSAAAVGIGQSASTGHKSSARNKDADSALQSDADATHISSIAEPQPHNINVTVPLQFFVAHSTLTLPTGSKASLLGFYDVTAAAGQQPATVDAHSVSIISAVYSSVKHMIKTRVGREQTNNAAAEPSLSSSTDDKRCVLYVRYRYAGKTFEITFKDLEQVALPNASADCLGGRAVT